MVYKILHTKIYKMKKTILLALTFFVITGSLSAQKMDFWIDAGLKVQTGFNALYNANATNGDLWDNTLTNGTKFGGKIGINFNYVGVSFDIMTGKQKGKFQDRVNTGQNREVSASVTDLYVLFRSARNKGYFEVGPKMSFISDITIDGSKGPDAASAYKNLYETKNLAAVLGFGTYILGPEDGRFSGIFGLRFEYGFQDMVNADGRIDGENRQPVNYTGDSASTNPIFAGIVFELNWGLGGVGQARCGERSKFIWF